MGSSRLQVIVTDFCIWQRRNLALFEFHRQSTYWVDFPKPCRSLSGTYAVPERTVYIGRYIAEQLQSKFHAAYMDDYDVVPDCTFDDAQFAVRWSFDCLFRLRPAASIAGLSAALVVLPFWSCDRRFVRECVWAMLRQRHAAAVVHVVADGYEFPQLPESPRVRRYRTPGK